MARGRKPQGDHTLTVAERSRLYRERHQAGAPSVRYRRPADRRSRAQRWRDAVAELLVLQDEYTAWLDTMPDSLREGGTGQALQAIVDLDLGELAGIEPPRGYGRD
jgi:hypothetical protein